MRPGRAVLAVLCAGGLALGCGGDQPPPLTSNALPRQQYILASGRCPYGSDGQDALSSARRGAAQLRALERAYGRDHDREVRVRRGLSDPLNPSDPYEYEVISVRELAEGHLEEARYELRTLRALGAEGRAASACYGRLIKRLETLLQSER